MNDHLTRSGKRTGSTSARYKPSVLVAADPDQRSRIGRAEVVASAAVALVAAALITLIWMVTMPAVQDQKTEIRDRAEQALSGQVADIAETVGHELAMIDQSLVILQQAWKLDSDRFDLIAWQRDMPALTVVADDLFIADDAHIIRQDILPQAVGQGVGAAYVNFPHGSLESFQSDGSREKDAMLLQGDGGAPIDSRQFLMYVIRPLDHPKGWLIGASYRSTELTRLFAQSQLGNNPVVALVDSSRGVVQAVVGPAARRPKMDLSGTPLFEMVKRLPTGTWLGRTAIDDVKRLHAFHRVADRDIAVVVAANFAEVMAPADSLASSTYAVAVVGTGMVLAIAGLVLWELFSIRSNRRQRRVAIRNRSELERLRSEESTNIARAQVNAARLQTILDAIAEGIALFDSALRLVQWNRPFLEGIGIEPRKAMPLDQLLREQAGKGLLGPVEDLEHEVARRAGILRAGEADGVPQFGPRQETLILRGLPVHQGGFILLLSGAGPAQSAEPPETAGTAPMEF